MKSPYTWQDIELIRKQPHILGLLAQKNLLTPLHSEFMLWCLDHHEKRGLQAHRASYKSVSITVIGTIWCLMFNPNETIGICRKNVTASCDMVREIMTLMEGPLYMILLHAWFADANNNIPDKAEWHFTVRKEGRLNLSVRTEVTKEPNIMALGIKSSVVGAHLNRLILDDYTGPEDRLYEAEREFTKTMVSELITNILNRNCPCTLVSTPWHRDDCSAVLEASGVPFRKYNVEVTGIMSPEQIEEARRTQSDPLFQANYMLSFASTEDLLFADPNKGIPWDYAHAKNVCAHLDCSYGGEDSTALSVACQLPDNKIGMVGFLWHRHVDDITEEIYTKLQQFKAHNLYMEENADKGYALQKILAHPLSKSYSIIGHSYRETQNKQVKIATHLHDRWYHILWGPETDDAYLFQICDWNEKSKTDDAPDSAASLLREAGFTTKNSLALWQ